MSDNPVSGPPPPVPPPAPGPSPPNYTLFVEPFVEASPADKTQRAAANKANPWEPCEVCPVYKANGEFDFEHGSLPKNSGVVNWAACNLMFPLYDPKHPEMFTKALTPVHNADAFYRGIKIDARNDEPAKNSPKDKKVVGVQEEIRRMKTAAIASLRNTGCAAVVKDVKDRLGYDICRKMTQGKHDGPNVSQLPAGKNNVIPFFCTHCYAKDIVSVVCVAQLCHKIPAPPRDAVPGVLVAEKDPSGSTKIVAQALLDMSGMALTGTAAEVYAAKMNCHYDIPPQLPIGFMKIIMLFPHDFHCQVNASAPFEYAYSPKRALTTDGFAKFNANLDSVLGDTFTKMQSDLTTKYMDKPNLLSPKLMKGGLHFIDGGDPDHCMDDRSYCILPRPEDSNCPLTEGIGPREIGRYIVRSTFHICASLGLEKEMSPFICSWNAKPRTACAPGEEASLSSGSSSGKIVGNKDLQTRLKEQVMWLPNKKWHLYQGSLSTVQGGADRVADKVDHTLLTHQKLHCDAVHLDAAIKDRHHPLYQNQVRPLMLPFSASIPYLEDQDRDMYFEHPSNRHTIRSGQACAFLGNKKHGGSTYLLRDCTDHFFIERRKEKNIDSAGRLWRATIHAHFESTHHKRTENYLQFPVYERNAYLDPIHLVSSKEHVAAGYNVKKADEFESAKLVLDSKKRLYNEFSPLGQAQLLMAREATRSEDEVTHPSKKIKKVFKEKAELAPNPTLVEASIYLAEQFLYSVKESSGLGVKKASEEYRNLADSLAALTSIRENLRVRSIPVGSNEDIDNAFEQVLVEEDTADQADDAVGQA